jgi:hypothetical protein
MPTGPVDLGVVDGKRKVRTFSTEADANAFAKARISERRQYGKAAFTFSEDERRDAAEALTILGGKHYPKPPTFPTGTLRAAAWYYMCHYAHTTERITVAEAFNRFMAENERNGLRKASLLSYGNMTGRYVRARGETIVADVTRRESDAWLRITARARLSPVSLPGRSAWGLRVPFLARVLRTIGAVSGGRAGTCGRRHGHRQSRR